MASLALIVFFQIVSPRRRGSGVAPQPKALLMTPDLAFGGCFVHSRTLGKAAARVRALELDRRLRTR